MFISAVIQFIDKKILIVSFASVIGVLILFIMLEIQWQILTGIQDFSTSMPFLNT